MGEIWRRLARRPTATAQLLVASLILNALGLASALYVIQVLNRYVSYGVTATLATLTAGMVLAIAGEHAFRRLRHHLAEEIHSDADQRLATGLYGLLLTARAAALDARPAGERALLMRGIEQAEGALGPATLTAFADLPFSLLFLAVLALLSPVLAMVAGGFCLAAMLLAWLGRRRLTVAAAGLREAAERVHALIAASAIAADAIRHFRGGSLLMPRWQNAADRERALRRNLAEGQQRGTSAVQAVQALMGVAVIGTGAVLVVDGALDVGALIGANLIAGRALAPLLRLVQLGESLHRAEENLAAARRFAAIELEPAGTKILPDWRGGLTLRGLSFSYPEAPATLFANLSATIEAGGVLVVTGRNGTGKTALVRLLAGLQTPSGGQILVDGVDLRQVSLDWWRRQVSYVPQEPSFIEGSLRENLTAARPDAAPGEPERCLRAAGLGGLIDEHPRGLDRPIGQGGANLAPGLRRRLALARALLVDGPLYLLDEPSEGLDREGAELVYALLVDLVRRGKTLVVVSHDSNILRGAGKVLRFDGREPLLVQGLSTAPGAAAEGRRP
ncbi:MAG: ATP-binding cassette domain-containing protein [Azospirillum sp.]|nr:ATP-binding cassette domain-containing protein [Azospirillum sp.]